MAAVMSGFKDGRQVIVPVLLEFTGSDERTSTQNIHNSSTRSHASEEENRAGPRSKNCKCKWAFRVILGS
jgi:hypothetical protein